MAALPALALGLALLAAPEGSSAPAAQEQLRLLIPPLEPRPGAPADKVNAISEFAITQARRVPGYRVLSMKDVEQMVSVEMQKQLLGCSESSCLAEIAGALSANEVLYGSVGRLGDRELVLTLNRIDPINARALAGESVRLPLHDVDGMLDATAEALGRLFPGYTMPPRRVQPMGKARLGLAMTAMGTVLQYAAVSSATFSLLGFLVFGVIGAPLLVPACGFCFLGPLATAWVQAWLMDVLGRRQVGIRRAALLGVLTVPVVAAVASLPVQAAAYVGGMSGMGALVVGALVVALLDWQGASTLFQGVVLGGIGIGSGLASVMGAMFMVSLALLPAIGVMVVALPALQSALLLRDSEARPPGEEPRLPGLYSTAEEPPAYTEVLPDVFVGGQGSLPPPLPPGFPGGVMSAPTSKTPPPDNAPAPTSPP